MITIKNLVHQYQQKTVLEVPELEIRQGEQWLLLGRSGSGKTTLLHILGGLLKASKGEVNIIGENLQTLSQSGMDRFRAKNIGIIFQKPHLIHTITVLQNLLMAQYMSRVKQNKNSCEEILRNLHLIEKKNAYPNQLSEGEAQRVSIARALLNRPAIILADEPTASLDDQNAGAVIGLLKEHALLHNATLVIATHDLRVKNKIGMSYDL